MNMDYTELTRMYLNIYDTIGNTIYAFFYGNSRLILDYIHMIFKSTFNVLIMITVLLASIYLILAILAVFRKRQQEREIHVGAEPFVTIQIPTYNELAAINCAKRCMNFKYPLDKMQIIIGDDSNNKEISSKIDTFAKDANKKHPGIILVTRRGNNEGFKPGNLNHMLKFSKGEIIVIFDSDFLPDQDFLPRLISPLYFDKNLAGAQARWKPINFNQNMVSVLGGTILAMCHQAILTFLNRTGSSAMLCGSAEAIRKKELEKMGGWQSGSLTEDIEYSLRLIKTNKKIKYLESLECECEVPYTLKDLCKQQMRWAYGVISGLKQHYMQIVASKTARLRDKLGVSIFVSGYLFSMLLLGITIFGILSLISDRPAAIDWIRFAKETSINLALTSGFLVASVISLALAKKSAKIPAMVLSSFTAGLVVTYYVNVGIIKAFFGRKMQWFMLKKSGNETIIK